MQQAVQQPQQQALQQAAAVQPEQAPPPQLQQNTQLARQSSSKRSKKAKARAAAAAAAAAAPGVNDALQEPQQQPQKPARSHRRMHIQAPLKFAPCGRGGNLKHAAAVSKHLSQGKQVLLPAGSGMQVARGVAALASARTLMLGHSSSTGLAFQPSFPAAAAAAQQQGQGQQLDRGQVQQGARQQDADSSSNLKQQGSSDSGIMMFVTGLPEAQLRRFEQSPLIAARYGSPSLLAGAAFARVCQQGFTAVHAAGPDAVAVALAAATQARRKLLGCGLDLAVVPMTEFVDIDSLTGPDGQPLVDHEGDEQQQVEYGPGDEYGRQCVRVAVLHLMRCEPQQPWQLLPWPPAPEQQPAVLWQAEQLELQQRAWLLQQPQGAAVQQPQRKKAAAGRDSARQQLLHGAVQQAAKAGGSVVDAAGAVPGGGGSAAGAVPASTAQARTFDTPNDSSTVSSAWLATSAAADEGAAAEADDVVLQASVYSHAQGMVARQGASVLLQKQRKIKRQLVAAAQSAAHGSKGSCSSGNGTAAS
jgi:stage V sporulation protein SpoVS